jgi:hypothetical protein
MLSQLRVESLALASTRLFLLGASTSKSSPPNFYVRDSECKDWVLWISLSLALQQLLVKASVTFHK